MDIRETGMTDVDEQRREFLVNALSAGFYALASGLVLPVHAMGKVPRVLPPGKSVYDLTGHVRVNKQPATLDTVITPGSTLETGPASYIIFAVGKDAFILRENSKLELEGGELIITSIRLLAGKLLSVFGKRPARQKLGLKTVVATIGIRGTGVYLESEPDRSYVCTCYGMAELAAVGDPLSREQVTTEHHDAPRYILRDAPGGEKIRPAPVINHSDDELALIEALVGRSVPFAAPGGYGAPRKLPY